MVLNAALANIPPLHDYTSAASPIPALPTVEAHGNLIWRPESRAYVYVQNITFHAIFNEPLF